MNGRYSDKRHIVNPTINATLTDIAATRLSRRQVLQGGLALGIAGLPLTQLLGGCAAAPMRTTTGFGRISASTAYAVRVPEGYNVQVFYRWGDPIGAAHLPAGAPAFKSDASNTAAEQERQAGITMACISFRLQAAAVDHRRVVGGKSRVHR